MVEPRQSSIEVHGGVELVCERADPTLLVCVSKDKLGVHSIPRNTYKIRTNEYTRKAFLQDAEGRSVQLNRVSAKDLNHLKELTRKLGYQLE